jgi:hypothetical protein
MNLEAQSLEFFEWHDGIIESIAVYRDSSVMFSFDHLSAWYSVEKNLSEVWSVKANVTCLGVDKFEITGKLLPDVWVSDGSVLDSNESEVSLLPAKTVMPARTLRLVMISGVEIRLSLAYASLEIISLIKKLENWTGPVR